MREEIYAKKESPYLFKVKAIKNVEIVPFSDVHYDSKKCDRKLLVKHLEEVVERGAYCFFNGDLLDVMGCLRDPRSGKGDIRPEYDVANYLDMVVDDLIEFLRPYKEHILFLGDGNHETNITRRQETNVLDRIAKPLGIERMGYSSWVKVQILAETKRGLSEKKQVKSYMIHTHHGFGGNAPRSKGVMRIDIDAAKYPDADIVLRGHTHQKWAIKRKARRINSQGIMYKKPQLHIQLGNYKDAYGDGSKGWEVEMEFDETTLGTYLLGFTRSKYYYEEMCED